MDAEDIEEFGPEGLCFGAFAFLIFPVVRELDGVITVFGLCDLHAVCRIYGNGCACRKCCFLRPSGAVCCGVGDGVHGWRFALPVATGLRPVGAGEDDPMWGRRDEVEQLLLGNLLRMNRERSGA